MPQASPAGAGRRSRSFRLMRADGRGGRAHEPGREVAGPHSGPYGGPRSSPWNKHLFHAKAQRSKGYQFDISVARLACRVTESSLAKLCSSLRSWRLCLSNGRL